MPRICILTTANGQMGRILDFCEVHFIDSSPRVWYTTATSPKKVATHEDGNKGGGEVDFLVQDNVTQTRRLVQVTWDMSDEQTFAREMNALKDAMSETGIKDGTVVTWDNEREIDGIRIVPAWKWCIG